ncbi:MAG: hypothetical protein JNJ88_18370 [Planctomycetes bacterium]|nr:hypothetical protein [Planctomycetota bacterium]
MKKLALLLATFALAAPTPGCLFAHTRSPLDTNLDTTRLGPKRGTSSAHSLLWLVAWGDASSAAAAKDAGITTLNHMDSEQLFVFFGLYTSWTTIVYGE